MEEYEQEMREIEERAATDRFKAFGPALGNFSIQYNLSCAGIAVAIMRSCSDDIGKNCKGGGDYPEPTWAKYLLMGTVFAGAVVGMLTMGYLGDAMGRRKALALTLSLTVLGSLGSAILPWGSAEVVYSIIAACRFVLGVGVGGIYPLSATSCAESSKNDGHAARRCKPLLPPPPAPAPSPPHSPMQGRVGLFLAGSRRDGALPRSARPPRPPWACKRRGKGALHRENGPYEHP